MTNTSHTQLIMQNCIDVTGSAPPEHKVMSRVEKWLRFSVPDDKGRSKSGALKVYDKGTHYVYTIKNHRTGITKNGTTRSGKCSLMTPEEKAAAQRQRAEVERQQAEQSARKHRMLTPMARRIWASCIKPETWTTPHPYITRKQVEPLNVRRSQSHKRDVLVLPMIDPLQGLRSLYLIYPNGFKRPLKGTQFSGLCMAIGHDLSKARRVWCVEGWATGVSLAEVTGDHVVIAFAAGNLQPVIDKLVIKYPNAELRLCADDDRATQAKHKDKRNPGLDYAKKVQEKHPQISLYKPIFPPDAPQGLSDVNDLLNWQRKQGGAAQ